jgi:phage shock protein C
MLRRTREKMLGGVCGGIAKSTGIDITLIRLIFVLLFCLAWAPMPLIYIILWIIMPEE